MILGNVSWLGKRTGPMNLLMVEAGVPRIIVQSIGASIIPHKMEIKHVLVVVQKLDMTPNSNFNRKTMLHYATLIQLDFGVATGSLFSGATALGVGFFGQPPLRSSHDPGISRSANPAGTCSHYPR